MLNLRNLILPALVVLTIILVSRETETTVEDPETVDLALQENFDYYITGMRTSQFDATGKLSYKLEATRVTHYPDTDVAKLENPHFFYFENAADPWELTAATGNLSNDPARNEEHLELFNKVVILKPMADGNVLTVTTEKLDVFPDSKEVNTQSPVTLETKGSRLESTGLRAHFDEEQIDLLSAIRGAFKNE